MKKHKISKIFDELNKKLDSRIKKLKKEVKTIPDRVRPKNRELTIRKLKGRIKEIKHYKKDLNKLKKQVKHEFKRELSEWNNIYYEQEEKIKELKTADVKHKMKINRLEKEIKHLKSEKELSEFEYIMKTSNEYEKEIKQLKKEIKKLKKDRNFEAELCDKIAKEYLKDKIELVRENRELEQTLEQIKKGEYIPEIFVDDLNELSRLREKSKEIAYNVKENTDKEWIEKIKKITDKYDYWFNEIQHLIAEIQRKDVKLSEFSERDLQKLYDQASKFLIELQELKQKGEMNEV